MQNPEIVEKNDKVKADKSVTNSFPVTGMTCAACASSVESILAHTDRVKTDDVNFASSVSLRATTGLCALGAVHRFYLSGAPLFSSMYR